MDLLAKYAWKLLDLIAIVYYAFFMKIKTNVKHLKVEI